MIEAREICSEASTEEAILMEDLTSSQDVEVRVWVEVEEVSIQPPDEEVLETDHHHP